jgi:iron(III) transport system permease protein
MSEWVYSLPGAVVVLSLVFYPLSMLATEVAVRGVDGRLEEAALLVAPLPRVLRRITLPLAQPAVVAAALVIFVLAVSDFGVPGLLRVRVYTTEVFTAFAALYDFSRAMLLTLPLLTLSCVVAILAGVLLGDRLSGPRSGVGAPPLSLDRWRWAALVIAGGTVVVAFLLPVAVLAREAVSARSLQDAIVASRDAVATSVLLAAIGATAVVALSVWVGYARARADPRVGRLADVLFVVLFMLPSTIVGVSLIGFWNRPGPAGLIYGTDGMILLGYLARLVPLAALTLAAGARLVPRSQEEAAGVGGAGWVRTMSHIVLPQMTPAIAATWAVVFVLAFGELGATILVAPPGESTLPVRIYTLIANAPSSQVAALALLQTGVILTVPAAFVLARAVWRKRS